MSDIGSDFARVPVPGAEQKGSIWIGVTSSAWVIAVTTLFTGGSLAEGLGLNDAVSAIVIGMLLVAVVGYLMGKLGSKHNVSTTMLAYHTFGKGGAALLGAILAITLGVGWFAWQVSFFALTLNEMYPTSTFADPRYSMVWAGLLMIATAYGGFRWLSWLSFVAVPLVLALATYGMILAASSESVSASQAVTDIASGNDMNIFNAVTAVVGSVIFGAIVLPDISRYAKAKASGAVSVALGYAISGVVVMIAGAVMVSAVNVPAIGQTANIPAAMSALGLGTAAFLILLFAQWTTNDSNLYSGALGLAAATNLPKGLLVLVMGIAGIVIASMNIQDMFVPFLVILGTFMPPVAGVMVADYYFGAGNGGTRNFESEQKVSTFNTLNILVAIASGIATYLLAGLGGVFASSAIIGFLLALIFVVAVQAVAKPLSDSMSIGVSKI